MGRTLGLNLFNFIIFFIQNKREYIFGERGRFWERIFWMNRESCAIKVKSRRRVPGLVPICDSRKKKLPELKPITANRLSPFGSVVKGQTKTQKPNAAASGIPCASSANTAKIELKIDWNVLRQEQLKREAKEKISRLERVNVTQTPLETMDVDDAKSDSSLLRAWADVRELNSREFESLAKEMNMEEMIC